MGLPERSLLISIAARTTIPRMRTVQGALASVLRVSCGLVLVACASGKPMPMEQDVDASEGKQDGPVEQMIDAAVHVDASPDAQVTMPDAAPCTPQVIEHLVNPALDLTPNGMGWVEYRDPNLQDEPGGPFAIISANPTGVTPSSAPNKAWLGGAAGGDVTPTVASLTDSLYQDVTFPAGANTFVVSFYYLVGTNESGSTVYDTFTLDVIQTNGTVIENVTTLSNATNAPSFTLFTKTLTTNLAGQTVRLRATSTNDDVFNTNFFLDSLSFKATHCP